METLTVRLRMPAVARLLLSELAGRRGQTDDAFLARLILREAVGELGAIVEGEGAPTEGLERMPEGAPHG